LSNLHEPGNAFALEIWHHSSCLKEATRTLRDNHSKHYDVNVRQRIEDMQLIMYVESCLSEDEAISINDINDTYITILRENRIEKAENQRKYLKTLIKKHLPHIKFVQPPRRNESENVVLYPLVGEAVDSVIKQDADSLIDGIMKLSRTMRNELMEYKDKWQFKAGLADFENPPLLHFLLEQILFGAHSKHVTGRRMDDCYKTVDVLSQVILQPMTDTGFQQRAETPVSISLPLSLHSRVRDKSCELDF